VLIFERIEWPALFFFGGLFVLVGGLVETGVISATSEWILQYVTTTGTAIFAITWFSAIASGIVDNIPLTAAMIPLIQDMALSPAIDEYPLWWALSLGACLGGNMTSVGASANVVVLGILDREGNSISVIDFFKVGFFVMVITVSIGLFMLYLMFPEAVPW
jgi:Na+/H+ antiporter NhaD/arsenite permease-like protein